MSRRGFEYALRQCRCALNNAKPSQQATRPFTRSSYRPSGQLPKLDAIDSTELETIFDKLRMKVFLPTYLNLEQRKLIFKPKNWPMLTAEEPFMIELGDETIQLVPIDKVKDRPPFWKSLLRAMELMGDDSRKWNNLMPLLIGFKEAGKKWNFRERRHIIRMAGEHGATNEIVQAIQAGPATAGMPLEELRIVREVMWACRMKAVLGGWDAESTQKALNFAEQVSFFLQDPVRTGRAEGDLELQTQPDLIGVVLELAAIRALTHLDGLDEDDKVQSYVRRLLPNVDLAADGGRGFPALEGKTLAAYGDEQLMRWVPVMNGLRRARELLGDETPQGDRVDEIVKDLEAKLKEAKAIVRNSDDPRRHDRKGPKWLEEVEASTS